MSILSRQEYVKQHIEAIDNPPIIYCDECGQELEVDERRRVKPCCAPEAVADQLSDAIYSAERAGQKADDLFPYIIKQMKVMMDTLGDTALESMIDQIGYDLDEIKDYINEAATAAE